MITIKSSDLWDGLKELAHTSLNKKAAVAYVSDDETIQFKKNDILIVDASDASIACGSTSANVLATAFEKGADLYCCDTLHAKVIVFDRHVYIGSANISSNSVNGLVEIGLITDQPSAMSGASQVIENLISQSKKIDRQFLDKILKIEVKLSNKQNNKRPNIVINDPTTWLVSVWNNANFPGDENQVYVDNNAIEKEENEERSWFFMRAGSVFYEKAKIGDSVVIIERDTAKTTEPERVYRHVTIQKITNDNQRRVKSFHYSYDKNSAVSWSAFGEIAKYAGLKRLGKGLRTICQLTEKQSNLIFELLKK